MGDGADLEDNCLKELLIANALLEHAKSCAATSSGIQLQMAYPMLVGEQHPLGHPDYPGMGSFFAVSGGGGSFPGRPSPATARAVGAFLRNKAGFSAEEAERVELMSVQRAVSSFTRLQGCQLWNRAKVCPSPEA